MTVFMGDAIKMLIAANSLTVGGEIYRNMTYANGIDPAVVIEMPAPPVSNVGDDSSGAN